jgi:chromosome segregation ATPase
MRPVGPAGPGRPRRRSRAIIVVSVLLVATLGLAGYLWMTTREYRELAASTEAQARVIGTELASTRAQLAGATDELAGVRSQLKTAQARITALADEKAQAGDAREAQLQLLDYQQRVSAAAGTVASALDHCVQGQNQLITYLKNPSAYDPAQLQSFGTQVSGLCQSATDANKALQDELAK